MTEEKTIVRWLVNGYLNDRVLWLRDEPPSIYGVPLAYGWSDGSVTWKPEST